MDHFKIEELKDTVKNMEIFQTLYVTYQNGNLTPSLHSVLYTDNEPILDHEISLEKCLENLVKSYKDNNSLNTEQKKELLSELYSILEVVQDKIKSLSI